ncbi:MAG: proline iminopeptidase-family hydrolase [Pseudomonadota bacterium]
MIRNAYTAGLLKRSLLLFLFVAMSSIANAEDMPRLSGFVGVEGGPVWFEIMGEGTRTPLVALHGGPGSTSCRHQVLAELGDERAVIRYDQLGSGRSGRPKDPTLWQRDRFVRELDKLREELNLQEVHILGHSWGGSLAAYYYLQTGGKGVQSLILSSPLISTKKWIEDANFLREQLPADIQAVLDEHEEAGTTDSDEYRDASKVFYDRHVTRGEPVEDYQCPAAPGNYVIYEKMWGPTEFHATGTLLDFDVTQQLKDIDVPTLFLTGEFDEARPETINAYAKMVKGAEMEVIPGVAHASATRAPELYRQLVRDFLNSVEAQAQRDPTPQEDK